VQDRLQQYLAVQDRLLQRYANQASRTVVVVLKYRGAGDQTKAAAVRD
jgi:hypothetical protein